MKAQEIIDDVLAVFGDRSGMQVSPEDIIRWINDAQLQMVRETGCFELIANYTSIVGEPVYALPDNFFKFRRVVYDGVPLSFVAQQDMDRLGIGRESGAVGTPTRYYKSPLAVVLYPAPVEIKGFAIEYVARPDAIRSPAQDLSIPEQFQPDLKQLCLSRCYETDENWAMAAAKEKVFGEKTAIARDDFKNPVEDSYPSVRDVSGYDDGGYYYG